MTASRHGERPDPTYIRFSAWAQRPAATRSPGPTDAGLAPPRTSIHARRSVAVRRGHCRAYRCWPRSEGPRPLRRPAAYHAGRRPRRRRVLRGPCPRGPPPGSVPTASRTTRFLAGSRRPELRPFHLNADLPPVRSPRDDEDRSSSRHRRAGVQRTVTVTSQDSSEGIHVVIPPGTIDGDRIEVPPPLPAAEGPPVVPARPASVPPGATGLTLAATSHVQLTLSPWEAAPRRHHHPRHTGRPVRHRRAPGTCSGRVLTACPPAGIPSPNGPSGNLHAHTHPRAPG